jgi:hypothetical protein
MFNGYSVTQVEFVFAISTSGNDYIKVVEGGVKQSNCDSLL